MNSNFRFGFTMEGKNPRNMHEQQSSQSMDNLFTIDEQQIEVRERSRQKKKKRHRDEEKSKKHKKQKRDKKSKKQKKSKKHRKSIKDANQQDQQLQIQLISSDSSDDRIVELAIYQDKNKEEQRILKKLFQETNKQDNTIEVQEFVLKYKISKNALPIDVIHFGQESIYRYGLRDSDIPVYKRPTNFNEIIGWWNLKNKHKHKKPSKKKPKLKQINQMKRIIHEINLVINQRDHYKNQEMEENNGSLDRYYHYQGYQMVQASNLSNLSVRLQQYTESSFFIEFEEEQGKNQSRILNIQQNMLQLSKKYNRLLSTQPLRQQLWLQFLVLQELTYNVQHNSIALINNNKSQTQYYSILDRKLSIIQKAALSLPNSEWLFVLQLIIMDQMSKQKQQICKFIESKLINVANLNFSQHEVTHNIEHLLVYLEARITIFGKYSHTYLLSQYEYIKNSYLDYKNCKSTKKIQQIRHMEQEVMHYVLNIIMMEGYQELGIGVMLANVELGLFRGQRNLEEYRQYYQSYKCYKLGQYPGACWNNLIPIKNNTEQYFANKFMRTSNKQFPKFLSLHPYFHQNEINQNPSSFLLFQDIQPFLISYRNRNSLHKTLDYLCELLALPYIYSQSTNQRVIMQWLQHSLFDQSKQANKQNWNFLLWEKYWPPTLTSQFIPQNKYSNVLYLLNILETIQEQFETNNQQCYQINIYPIRQYLLFLYCVLHNESDFHKYFSDGDLQNKIKDVFGKFAVQEEGYQRDYYYCRAWAIYVEFMIEYRKSTYEECFGCLYACFEGISNNVLGKLMVLYWIQKFNQNNRSENVNTKLLQYLLKIILNQQLLPDFNLLFTLQYKITEMDRLLAGNTLKQFLKQLNPQIHPEYLMNFYRVLIYNMLMLLGQNPSIILQKIVPKMLTNTKSDKDYGIGRMFIIELIVSRRILKIENLMDLDMFKLESNGLRLRYYINIKLILFWLEELTSRHKLTISSLLVMIQNTVNCNRQGQFNLFTNAILFKLLVTKLEQNNIYLNSNVTPQTLKQVVLNHIQDRFEQKHPLPYYLHNTKIFAYEISKHRTFSTSPLIQSHHSARELELLNIFMQDPEFSLKCLDRLPYSRQSYRIVAEKSTDQQTRQKIKGSILEKQIPNL